MDTVKPALPEVLQSSNGTDKARTLTTTKFVIKQVSNSYSREVANILGNLGSVYSYHGTGTHINWHYAI